MFSVPYQIHGQKAFADEIVTCKHVVMECAPARLRRERRWVRSSFGGEFNAALVAPSSSRNDETWLPEWSAGLTVHENLDEHIAKKLV
jgi:hypothetical protein